MPHERPADVGHLPLDVGSLVKRRRVTWFQRRFLGMTEGPFVVRDLAWSEPFQDGPDHRWQRELLIWTDESPDWVEAEGYEVVG